MEWKNVCQRLDTVFISLSVFQSQRMQQLKGKLTKEAEKGRKTLSLHTTHAQTCISFSEKYRYEVDGDQDNM